MSLDKAFENFTVLHISDLHGAEEKAALDIWRTLLYGKRFDAVVLSGDMVGNNNHFTPLITLIQNLQTIKPGVPIYIVAGDEDPAPLLSSFRGTPEAYADWVLAVQNAGAIYLDAPVSQTMGRGVIWFIPESLYNVDAAGMINSLTHQKEEMEARGLPYEAEGGASYRALLARIDAMERTLAATKLITPNDLQIAVTHVPLEVGYVRTALEWASQEQPLSIRRVNLVLAGHYTGGQWRFFQFGPIFIPEQGWFPGDEGFVGLQRMNSVNQYISAGLEASNLYPMPGRLLNPPSAALLTFTARIE